MKTRRFNQSYIRIHILLDPILTAISSYYSVCNAQLGITTP